MQTAIPALLFALFALLLGDLATKFHQQGFYWLRTLMHVIVFVVALLVFHYVGGLRA